MGKAAKEKEKAAFKNFVSGLEMEIKDIFMHNYRN